MNYYELQPWQWDNLMRWARDADNYGEYVRFILHLAATPSLLQLERHAYPGQPSKRTTPPPPRCTCRYIRWYAEFTITTLAVATGFQVNPECPHHGRLDELTIEGLWNDPALNVFRDAFDMDDDERRSP